MSVQLHETVMGRRLIEHTLPKIARALERVADAMDREYLLKADTKEDRTPDEEDTVNE